MITRITTKLYTLYLPNLLKENNFNIKVFFLSEFSFTDTKKLQDSWGMEGNFFYSTPSLSPAQKHSDIYLQFACEMTITYF